jgi:3-hydroxyisobutyrate dehydrogenase-like beta-hydroxyacid dehydrogenase
VTVTGSRGTVGIAGLGDMGSAIAGTLLRAGWTVRGYDLKPERLEVAVAAGVRPAESLKELAEQAVVAGPGSRGPVVAIVVDGEEQLDIAAAGLSAAAPPGSALIVHTTTRPAHIVALAEAAAERNVHVVDAAVGGGSEKARLGALTLMIGGDTDAVSACWPVFETIGTHLFRLGPPGAGMAAKLVNNVLGITSYAMLLEAMQFAAAYGMDEDAVTSLITTGWADSRHARAWGRQDRRRRERLAADAHAYSRMSRDLRNAVSAARVRDVEMPLTETAAGLLPALLRARDEDPRRWRPGAPAPRCSVCGIELAAPFRSAGAHPECLTTPGIPEQEGER